MWLKPFATRGDYSQHIAYVHVNTIGDYGWQNQNVLIQRFIFFFEESEYLQYSGN